MSKKPKAPDIPKSFTSYILLNPAYPVEVVYQILSHQKRTEPIMIIKGKPEDFIGEPQTMFRKVNQPVNLNDTTINTH